MITKKPYLREVSLNREKSLDFREYPFDVPAVRRLNTLRFHPDVTFIVGENGSGKSTLLEALAVAWRFNPEGGSRNFNFATRASHSSLHESLKIVRSAHAARDGFFFRAESFYNVSTYVDEVGVSSIDSQVLKNAYGGRSLHEQSHGEAFISLVMSRFRGKGLYILDEPEAALSPTRQLAVLIRMHELVEQDSQFIIATHSPILMSYPRSTLYFLDEKGYKKTDYKETPHYQIVEQFISKPESLLRAIDVGES